MAEFFAASKVLIVAGKGGVGKTTLGAIVGVAAARCGLSVLLVETAGLDDGVAATAPGLGSLLDGRPLGFDPRAIDHPGPGSLSALRLDAGAVLAEYLMGNGFNRIGDRLVGRGAIDVLIGAAPGIKDLLVLGKIRRLAEDRDDVDLIVVDGPAAGHAISFLRSPRGFRTGTSAGGPIHQQARLAEAFLADSARCQVLLVTTAEPTPVTETIEAAFDLEDDLGIALAPLVVNGLWREIDGLAAAVAAAPPGVARDAGEYRLGRIEAQRAERSRLLEQLPLRQIPVEHRFVERLSPAVVREMADDLLAGAAS